MLYSSVPDNNRETIARAKGPETCRLRRVTDHEWRDRIHGLPISSKNIPSFTTSPWLRRDRCLIWMPLLLHIPERPNCRPLNFQVGIVGETLEYGYQCRARSVDPEDCKHAAIRLNFTVFRSTQYRFQR